MMDTTNNIIRLREQMALDDNKLARLRELYLD